MKIYSVVVASFLMDDYEIIKVESFNKKDKANLFIEDFKDKINKYSTMKNLANKKENKLLETYSVKETYKQMESYRAELNKFRTDNLFGYEYLWLDIFENELK